MWCNDRHDKVQPYHVEKSHRHISLHWNLKKWIQKFSLKQQTLNQIRQFVKDLKSNLELCPSSTMTITNKNTFLKQPTNELSPNQHIPFEFVAPKQVDLIGSFLFYGICFNANHSHTDHYNVDISVTIPSPTCITLKDITTNNTLYLLKRRAYLHILYQHLQSNQTQKYPISIEYLNHDRSKPIIVIKATQHCYVRIIPSLDIKQFITSDSQHNNNDTNSDDDNDSDDEEELDEKMIMDRVFFGSFYKKYRIIQEQYANDLTTWSFAKLSQHLYPENIEKHQLFKHYLCGQQILEDISMRSTFFDFYGACKHNPNLHRALVLIKAWWNNSNFHRKKGSETSDSTRFGDINSFHLTMLLLLFHRSYHIDKWDSPLVVMAKFLELVSREELGTLLCQTPPCSLFERNPQWYTSFGDSHLFTSLTANISNNKDRASIFDPKKIDFSEKDSKSNANIYDTDNEDGDAVSNVYYSYNIWKTKKKGISMSLPNENDDGDGVLDIDGWIDANHEKQQQTYLKLLCNQLFPVVFTNVSGRMNYTFRVNRCNYLHFIKEARKASHALNTLLMEIPFMPNPEYWSYSKPINPVHYDIVRAPIMTFHQKCIQQLLTPNNLQFFMYFDGFIKLNIKSLVSDDDACVIYVLNNMEHILLNALSDRCRSFVLYYDDLHRDMLYIGLTMHTFAFREMILGPPKDEKFAVRKFREFWGNSYVLNKRFPDGTLLNTVTLSNRQQFETYLKVIHGDAKNAYINKQRQRQRDMKKSTRYNKKDDGDKITFKRPPSYVIKVLLYHILHRHLGLNTNDIELRLDPFWSITPSFVAHAKQIGDKTDIMKLERAYERLERILASICSNKEKHGIPLRLGELVSIDAHLWNTAISIPRAKNMVYCSYSLIDNVEAIHVGIKFESSDFWPKSNLRAVNHLKLAFYIQLHRALLSKSYKVRSLLSKKHIDIIMNGFNFRCFIVADTEFMVHKFESARSARYHFKFLPKLGHVLQGISKNYAYFSPTISIIKRWLHCNLFSELIDEYLITVLVADLFVNSDPYPCPQSAFIAFIRFLYVLSTFNWIETPYIVDLGLFNHTILSKSVSCAPTSYQYNIFKSKMLNARMNDEGLHSMFVVSPGLEDHSSWTKHKPTLTTLDRLVTTSRLALRYLLNHEGKRSDDAYLRVFKPSKDEFDFIINLNTSSIPKYMDNMWKTQKGINQWREKQIVKRMGKMTMEQEKNKPKHKEKTKMEQNGETKGDAVNAQGLVPFIPNPIWEQKKRKFEELHSDLESNQPSKKRKLNENTFERMIEENPEKFLEENELFVIGVNPVQLFLNEINKYTNQQIEVYYDKNGGDFIGCKWLIAANDNTQKTVYAALWELGLQLIKSIKVNQCPSKSDIDESEQYKINTVQKLKEMLNVMHVDNHNEKKNGETKDDGWTVVDSKHNI